MLKILYAETPTNLVVDILDLRFLKKQQKSIIYYC